MGKIFKIRVGHNGSGVGSGWFLESVDVKHLTVALVPKEKKKEDKKKKKKKKEEEDKSNDEGEELREVVMTHHFPCSRWLASGEEDGELVVELLPEDAEDLESIKYIFFAQYNCIKTCRQNVHHKHVCVSYLLYCTMFADKFRTRCCSSGFARLDLTQFPCGACKGLKEGLVIHPLSCLDSQHLRSVRLHR